MKDKDESEKTGPERMDSEGGSQRLAEPEIEMGCASCGANKSDWQPAEGVEKDGKTYCSQSCIDKTASRIRDSVSRSERSGRGRSTAPSVSAR